MIALVQHGFGSLYTNFGLIVHSTYFYELVALPPVLVTGCSILHTFCMTWKSFWFFWWLLRTKTKSGRSETKTKSLKLKLVKDQN